MSWKEFERIAKKLGIEMASTEDLRRAGVFGTSFIRRGPLSVRLVNETKVDGRGNDRVDDDATADAAFDKEDASNESA